MSETAAQQMKPDPPRAARWVKYGLIASLALNFLLIGLLAGGAWVHRRVEGLSSTTIQAARYVRRLPDARRTEIREAMRPEIARVRELRGNVRALREAARGLLTRTPFDKAAYAAAQQRVLDAEIALRKQGTLLLVETVGMMSPDERQGLASMEERRDRRSRDRRGGRPENGEAGAPKMQP